MFPSLALALAAVVSETPPAGPPKPALTLAASIELPRVEGRIDHLALDRKRARLFVAALANDTLEVLDVAGMKHVKSIAGLGEPQGIVHVEDADRVAVACGESGLLEVFDAGSLERVASVKVGPDADNVRYEPRNKVLVVAFGDGGLAIVDPKSWKLSGQIALDAHPESFQIDASGTTAYVNVPNKSAIVIVDLVQKKVTGRIDVSAARKNYPMLLVDAEPRLLVGCREPAKLLVYDMATSKLASELRISGDVDDLFLDARRGLIYAACGEGFVDVLARGESGAWAAHEKVPTAAGARTCLFVPEERRLFVAVPHREAQRAEVRVYRTEP